jgi:undecaprenyl-diphosphatase
MVEAPALQGGAGLGIAVNTLSGSYSAGTIELLRESFPDAHIVEIAEGSDVAAAIREIADGPGTIALGVWGGDGTVGTAAAIAIERSLPLLVLPGGTLNHFARDAGAHNLAAGVSAASAGSAVSSDLGHVSMVRGLAEAGETLELAMLNTASIGVYPNLVRRRERLQGSLGKPLAGLVAGLRTFAVDSPTTLKIDGVVHKVWIVYLGRGRYYPRDMAPLARPVLDDGQLDVRMLGADKSFDRLRLLWAVLTGTVSTTKVTHLREATRVVFEAVDGPLVLAVDGEPLTGVRSAEFTVLRGKLRVYSPQRDGIS